MRENILQRLCIQHLNEKGIYNLNIHGSSFISRGAPDVIACINGTFVAIEFKVGTNDLEPAQRIHRNQIITSGGKHAVIRDFDTFKQFIRSLEQK